MSKINNKLYFLFRSILAGWVIGLGSLASFSTSNRMLGAALFSIGILLVMLFGFNLYTGYIPKLSQEKQIKINVWNIPICLCGNIIGTQSLALCCYGSKYNEAVIRATELVANKNNLFAGLLSGVSCGIVIGLIVLNSHKTLKWIMTPLLIMTFILSGMEHCIADAFYMGLSRQWKPLFLLMVIIGNTIGGYIIGKTTVKK